jgi:predicted DNA binding CopG/RHH family protein
MDATVNMRMPAALLDAIKARAAARGIPYQRLIREALEKEVEEKEGGNRDNAVEYPLWG